MHPTHLVGIHGLKRTGKDTFARMLIEEMPMGTPFKLRAYADHLKDITAAAFQIPREWFDGDDKDTPLKDHGGASIRELLCKMADAMKIVWGERYFCEHVMRESFDYPYPNVFIVTDVRYEYEADWIRERGGRIVHVSRPTLDAPYPHSSEAGIVRHPDDYYVQNDGTLDDLRFKVQEFIAAYLVGYRL